VWRDILSTNLTHIDESLRLYINALEELRQAVAAGTAKDAFNKGENFALLLRKSIR
jgi:hypothetical protein